MKLQLIGHDYKYAVEQIMMVLLPGEKPEYPKLPPKQAPSARVSLSLGPIWATARTVLRLSSGRASGISRVKVDGFTDNLTRDRLLQRILKQSFYKAYVSLTGDTPAWGALTGIRPAKLMSKAIKEHGEAFALSQFAREFFVTPSRTDLALRAARASISAETTLAREEISLYIGIPFCPTRCAYCSFISADVKKALALVEPYLSALEQEIDAVAELLPRAGARIRTVYIGGGTPTTLTPAQLQRLISRVREKLDLSSLTEFTVEAGRPDTITKEKMDVLYRLGVDRVSVNPQSMESHVLQAMGRAHTPEDILRAYDTVRQSGIPAVNMDLIAGLPRDSADGFRLTLDTVLSLDPENITVHTLALKRGARLMLEQQSLPSGEETSAMLDYAWPTLTAAGHIPYYLYRQKYMSGALENVGWCKPGFEGLYNLCIMEELHTIVALGAGGSTKLTDPVTGKIRRITNPKYPQEYIQRISDVCLEKEALVPFQRALLFRN